MTVKLVWVTPDAEKMIARIARVSNPGNQENPDYKRLLTYCIKHSHWSVFEQSYMSLEIRTSRAVSAQMLRHRSFVFQEFSQRYAQSTQVVKYDARRQDVKNRQNSTDDLPQETKAWWNDVQIELYNLVLERYEKALALGIAKECARMILPLATETTLYMTGNIRSWITYCKLRQDKSTQLEHRIIADEIWEIFKTQCPTIAAAVEDASV